MKILAPILALQSALFVALPWTGSEQSWGVFSSFNAEIAAAMLRGQAPWDRYDGLVAGPLALATLELPLLAALGRSPWVHVLSMLAVSLAGTVLGWAVVRRLAGARAAAFAAALVAFPPPNTWYHQHQGAYHLLGLLGMPAAMLLLMGAGARTRWGRETLGWGALFGGLALAPGGIGPAAAVGGGMWLLRLRSHPRAAWQGLRPAVLGAALASAPLVYKGAIHRPFGGLVSGHVAAAQTKPFFLGSVHPADLPARLMRMIALDLPYGLHFGSSGVPLLGGLAVILGGLAWTALLARARRDPADRALLPLLLVPPAALAVGLLTGWFVVGRAPGQEPFPRDARHLLPLTCFGSWILGIFLSRLRWPGIGELALGALVIGSVGTQGAAMGPSRGIPFRLESAFVQGFFAGPVLVGQPGAAVSWCSQGPRRLDCLRGVALSWGHRPAEQAYGLRGLAPDGGPSRVPSQLRRRCSSLARAAGDASGALKESCFFGLGFGLSDQTLRRLAKGVRSCEGLALRPEEVRACRRGVGWGQAQNFWNRPGAMRRWLGEQLRGQARIDSAEGIGVLLAMLSRDPAWVRSECAAQVPPDSTDACRRGAASNRRFMPEEEP